MMALLDARSLSLAIDENVRVSALLQVPKGARACLVLAHGAGAGMTHPLLAAVAQQLADSGVARLRFQFPFMEQREKRPDPPHVAHATVRAGVAEAPCLSPDLPVGAGGKSLRRRPAFQAHRCS